MIKAILSVSAAIIVWSNVAQAETTPTEKTHGQLMAVMVMSQRCQVPLSSEIVARIDVEGPRLQKAAGIQEADMAEIGKEISQAFSDSDCPSIKDKVEGIAISALHSAKAIK